MVDEAGSASAPPRRIAVIGRAGAGKTWATLVLGEAFGLPVVHLDQLYWGPRWQPIDQRMFDSRQAEAIADETWVIDGNYLSSPGWRHRLERADVVVLVEAPLAKCLSRIVRRSLGKSSTRRPDLPAGCDEALSLYFVWWTIGWAWRNRQLVNDLKRPDSPKRLVLATTNDGPAALVVSVEGRLSSR